MLAQNGVVLLGGSEELLHVIDELLERLLAFCILEKASNIVPEFLLSHLPSSELWSVEHFRISREDGVVVTIRILRHLPSVECKLVPFLLGLLL